MVGLPNNNHLSALHQWRKLFFEKQNNAQSTQAYTHWQSVERLGMPTHKHEHWKYISLKKFLAYYFSLVTHTVMTVDHNTFSLGLNAYRLIFINGFFIERLSDTETGVWHIEVEQGSRRKPLPSPIYSEVFLHLTESFSQETIRICLPSNRTASKPLYLLHISQGNEDKKTLNMMHYRHHIDIEMGARGEVIEHFVSMDQKGHFSGARTSITVGDNAHLNYIKLAFENHASYHFGYDDIIIGQNAVVRNRIFVLGSELARHQTSVQLNGEGSDLLINSLMLPFGESISNTSTYLEHNKGYCLSRQLHKIIAGNRGKGIFNGLIKVAKYALKTDSHMINNSLLMNRLAEVNTNPQLEIYTDDVKCSHGATIGCIDEEQMFYLRSRGIIRTDSQKMILSAFLAEVIEIIHHDTVREIIQARIEETFQEVV
ncbi:Fe-S cluster assembly protein SufD [Candidatus Curculioniphilus buchneri]|uniref:Fe-S cluster assembly protein SufD n=1 Tax=Candidatus Curculioniphilus buchneri TaxID=690594 RepID=UPI00376EF449